MDDDKYAYWWNITGSNRRPPRCERGALPAELMSQRVIIIVILKEKENAFSRTISICNCKVSKNSTRVASFSRLNAFGRRLLSPFSFICSKYLFWRWRLVFIAFIMTSYKAVFFVIVKFLTYFAHCFETLKIQGFFLFESPFLIRSHDTNDSHH